MADITEEVAKAEIARFAEAMDLDLDPAGMDDEDKKSLAEAERKLVRAMLAGQLVINECGEPVVKTSAGQTITFKEPKGAALMEMDQRKKSHDIARLYTVMGAITGLPTKTFSDMANRDVKVCIAITNLFLG